MSHHETKSASRHPHPPRHPGPHGYDQWVIIKFKNSGSKAVKLTNLDVSWGKLHVENDKDKEVDPSTVNNSVIEPGDTLQINACGRHTSPSGTTGDLDLVDTTAGDKKIRHFYWDCPWASSKNTWTVSGSNEGWMVESDGANLEDGALGTITVEFLNKA
ncbi:pleurotolysin A [Polyporus arcularius HHB13444]|uniref:Pleurotolysin A n=1 Tax=Polyporus arcularius HHB13444 TaxID=1314778 RepID=A0A5C3PGW6_9APHY|nr:pleurotolysin A [Polyporus arcularius HHB13444]